MLVAAPLLALALLVVVAGAASATDSGEAPMVVSADDSGSLGVVSTAQSDTETDPESETEPRLVGRESSERVDGVVIALWSIAAGMTVMLAVFLWHTSPRRRLRLARRRSTQLYDGEADQAEGAAGAEPAAEGATEVAEAAERGTAEVPESAEEGTAEGVPQVVEASRAEEVPEVVEAPVAEEAPEVVEAPGAEEVPGVVEASGAEEVPGVVEVPVAEEAPEPVEAPASGPEVAGDAVAAGEPAPGRVLPPAWEEPETALDLPPVWEDEANQAGGEAEESRDSRTDVSPRAGTTAREGALRFWARLRHTLGLD